MGVAVALFFLPLTTHAASFVFSPESGSFAIGEEFTVKVSVDPGKDSVNAGDGALSFSTELLSISNVSKEGSVFSLWTTEPKFSNTDGTVTFSGGTPTAFSSAGQIFSITFKPKALGNATLTFTKGTVLAADGKGTDVYAKGQDATYTLTPAKDAPVEVPDDTEAPDSAKPEKPAINSSTHPKEENWYSTSTVEYSWKVADDITSVRSGFSEKEDDTPKVTHKITVTSRSEKDVKDGVWYVLVQYRNEFGWGEIAKRTIRIDTLPPNEFDFSLDETGEAPRFKFQTDDTGSGIEKYEILLGESTVATAKPTDVVQGAYPVPPQDGGVFMVTIRALDKAGNARDIKKELTLPKVNKPTPKGKEEEKETPPFFTFEKVLAVLAAIGVGAMATIHYNAKKNHEKEKERILHEVTLVRDKNDKIFSALREEFEDLVNNLDEKPQLTPAERDFLENISEALDISEELIDSGMEELKKNIRG